MSATTVISISLTEKNIEGNWTSSRSSLALQEGARRFVYTRSAESEIRERRELKGDLEGILIAVHKVEVGHELDEASHKYQKNITTQVHSHLKDGKVLDGFLVGGDSATIKNMIADFQKDEALEYIKFVQS